MTSRLSYKPVIFLLLLATSFAPSVAAQENVYQPTDPAIGYNLISYKSNNQVEVSEYFDAIDQLASIKADHVNLVVFRRVRRNGRVDFSSGPTLSTIFVAAKHAKSRGLKVTITPIFETETGSAWRGEWNPTGVVLKNFRIYYALYLRRLAIISKYAKVDKLNVGSELVAFVNQTSNQRYLERLVVAVERVYKGELGYNANWDNFKSEQVKKIFWDDNRISTLSVSMYPYKRLASFEEADQSHVNPAAFAALVKSRWKALILGDLLPYASNLKDGNGMPIAIGEFGAVPLNRSAAIPASFEPSDQQDTDEQKAVIMGLIRSVDQLGSVIPEVTIWQWGIGDLSDRFGLNPFHESPQQATALEILRFMQTADDDRQ